MTQDVTSRTGPVRVLWVLANDRPKADTISLVRWVRAHDRSRIALTAAFLSAPTGRHGLVGELDATIPHALADAGAEVVHWPLAGGWSGRGVREAADFVASQRVRVVQSVFFRADLFASRLRKRIADVRWIPRLGGIGRFRRVRLYGGQGGWLDRLIYRGADHLVAVSGAVRDDWSRRLRREAADFTVIHNCVPDAPALGAGARAHLKLSAQDRVIVTAGRLDREKGIERLIDAAAMLLPLRPDLRFVALGDGRLRQRLGMRITRAGLMDRFVLAGDSADVWAWLSAADIYVQPSRMEGFPNAVLEAAAAGKPVVATATGGVTELLTNQQDALLVDAGASAAAIGDAISQLLTDAGLARRLGEAARRRVREHFSPQRAARAYSSLYDRMVPP